MIAATPRIDAHQHYWKPERGDYFWMDRDSPLFRPFVPIDLQPSLERHDIAGTVLVQAAPTLEETSFLIDLAENTASVLGIVGWVDFEERLHGGTLERLAMHPKFKGVRPMIQDIADPKWVCHANLDWAFDAVAELELCFDALVIPEQLPFLLKRLLRQPTLKVVVDHGAKPFIRDGLFEPWAALMTRVATETSASVKLSGMVTEAAPDWSTENLRPYADHLLASFGAERVIWDRTGRYAFLRAPTIAGSIRRRRFSRAARLPKRRRFSAATLHDSTASTSPRHSAALTGKDRGQPGQTRR